MNPTLTVLVENTVGPGPGLLGEHGFSILLERGGEVVLVDTGRGAAITHNAARLGKDLGRVNKIVLTHGHIDHTGGLPEVLKMSPRATVHAHPGVFTARYWVKGGSKRPIGMPVTGEALSSAGATVSLSSEFTQISSGLYLTGEVPRKSAFETGDEELFIDEGGGLGRDPVSDDLSLVVKTGRGLLVILGCAHAGLINILNFVAGKFPGEKIIEVIGGTHLGPGGEHQLEETIKVLRGLDIEKIGLSHCTGLAAACRLRSELGDRVFFANTGYSETFI